ncbi:aminotransferase class I/II-fold pyridoxal phosphate-dependent enzyme [Aquimarina gracilis]|uniref:Aminotransferase n=1 Tax=Aquimarina gracilis TaxID=874422 RepID=A0ABU5ZT15_9FLAO|nr:aminotransferase class I/II-fold pyridoxal phosphate-dependent enzyme [Aquimarina gracilis]MEB3345098.1 aminotransferase class I/II-fold pyridoxal phosphate-dependent enzyme [Aquimarina gracilis]
MILSQRVKESISSSTVRIADKAQRLREQGEVVFDFSAGRAFEPTPDYISKATINAINNGDTHQTMAKGKTIYREAIAKKLARENKIIANPDTELIATMGCKQGLTIGLLATMNPGDEVIVEDPCFVSYKQTIQYLGGKVVEVPLREENNFRWDKKELEEAITSRTKVIIMCSPHNPTGTVHTKSDLEMIANIAIKHGLIVITDEVYERVTWGKHRHINLSTIKGMKERTITLISFTKSFSMGGWRVGFIYSSEEIIKQLEKLQQHLITSVNSFVQIGAAIACENPPSKEVLKYWKDWEDKIRYVTTAINDIPRLECKMPEGGFYAWTKINIPGISSLEFTTRLLEEYKVAVVDGASFGKTSENYFRFTCVKSWEEIKEGLDRLQKFVETL